MRASSLRSLSVDKQEVLTSELLPDTVDISLGTLIPFECHDAGSEGLLAGTVAEILQGSYLVQICQPKRGVRTWLPRCQVWTVSAPCLQHEQLMLPMLPTGTPPKA